MLIPSMYTSIKGILAFHMFRVQRSTGKGVCFGAFQPFPCTNFHVYFALVLSVQFFALFSLWSVPIDPRTSG
jgi:hypothetical protein